MLGEAFSNSHQNWGARGALIQLIPSCDRCCLAAVAVTIADIGKRGFDLIGERHDQVLDGDCGSDVFDRDRWQHHSPSRHQMVSSVAPSQLVDLRACDSGDLDCRVCLWRLVSLQRLGTRPWQRSHLVSHGVLYLARNRHDRLSTADFVDSTAQARNRDRGVRCRFRVHSGGIGASGNGDRECAPPSLPDLESDWHLRHLEAS